MSLSCLSSNVALQSNEFKSNLWSLFQKGMVRTILDVCASFNLPVFFWFFCFSFFVGFCFFVFGLFVCLFPFSFYYVPPYYSHVEFIVIVWVCLTVFVNVSAFYFRNLLTASFHSEWEVSAIYGCTCMCVLVVSILFLYLWFYDWTLELFRQCGIYFALCFLFFCFCLCFVFVT